MNRTTTRLVNETPDAVALQVRDRNDVDHRIVVEKGTGEIVVHQYNDYPADRDACSPEQRRAIRAARADARYVAHEETDDTIVGSASHPSTLRAGIRVLEALPTGEFVRYFREYYDEIREPSVSASTEIDSVSTVTAFCHLDPDADRLEYVTGPVFELEADGETRLMYSNPADTMTAPDRDPDVRFRIAPGSVSVSFGDPFRSFLIDHLKCQIRDIYWLRDQPIPEDCQLEGDGNPDIQRIRTAVAGEVAE